jgi:hypothetical protein
MILHEPPMSGASLAGRARRAVTGLLGVALVLSAWPALSQRSDATVTLSADAQHRLGIAISSLVSVRHSREIDAFAKVLDPASLIQSENDLATAEVAAVASRAEAARALALHQSGNSISAKDQEAAQAQAKSDALKIALARQQIALQWGPGVARLPPARRRALVAALVRGTAALVHVDTHNNEGQLGARRVKIDVGGDSVEGIVIGPARAAEPRLQSSGLIVEVTGHDAILLAVGLTQSAHIEQASAESGVIIPRSAVIRFQGADWAYVRSSPSSFRRRLIQDPAIETGGLFVSGGFSAGDQIVTAGATSLFAAELARQSRGD